MSSPGLLTLPTIDCTIFLHYADLEIKPVGSVIHFHCVARANTAREVRTARD